MLGWFATCPFTTYNEMICQQVNLPPSCFNTNIAKLTWLNLTNHAFAHPIPVENFPSRTALLDTYSSINLWSCSVGQFGARLLTVSDDTKPRNIGTNLNWYGRVTNFYQLLISVICNTESWKVVVTLESKSAKTVSIVFKIEIYFNLK